MLSHSSLVMCWNAVTSQVSVNRNTWAGPSDLGATKEIYIVCYVAEQYRSKINML